MKRSNLVLLSLFSVYFCFSQSPSSSNTLLWRIDDKNGNAPSYLYGTMHLLDKRVFQLGDSLYKGLENTTGFAAELDMRTVGTDMMNELFDEREEKEKQKSILLKDAVSPEIWSNYKNALKKRFNKNPELITVGDLETEQSKMELEMLRKGEMPAFLDAYLFGMAQRMGKWVGGLEDIQDQNDFLNAISVTSKLQAIIYDSKYYQSGVEQMINVYTNQRLDSIEARYNQTENGKKDIILERRNIKMARVIDSLMQIRSMFVAIGAAHLPGEMGVIALLRKRGFVVTPVFSSKKISAEKYIIQNEKDSWVTVTNKAKIYTVKMPGKAAPIKRLAEMGVEIYTYADFSTSKFYMSFGIEIPENRRKLGIDSLYKSFAEKYDQKMIGKRDKKIIVNGVEGREYLGDFEGYGIKFQIFLPDNARVAVFNATISMFGNDKAPDVNENKFFESFIYNKSFITTIEKDNSKWETYYFPQNSFRIKVPQKFTEKIDTGYSESKAVYNYETYNVPLETFFGMKVVVVKSGYYDSDTDSSSFIAIKDDLMSKFTDGKIIDSGFSDFNGYPAYHIHFKGKTEGADIEGKIFTVQRGNRNFYLYSLFEPNENGRLASQQFIESLELIPFNIEKWVRRSNDHFSILAKDSLLKSIPENAEYSGLERYQIHDEIGATDLYIDVRPLPEWFAYSSDTAFVRSIAEGLIHYDDTLDTLIIQKSENAATADLWIQTKGFLQKRMRVIATGNKMFEFYSYLSKTDMENTVEKVLNSFQTNTPAYGFRTSVDFEKLKRVMNQNDTAEIKYVKYWWSMMNFGQSDITQLQKLFLKRYSDFDTTYYYSSSNLNNKIYESIKQIDTLNTTVDFIENNYSSIKPEDQIIKPFVISYLSFVHTKESYDLLKELVTKQHFDIDSDVSIQEAFTDSLALTKSLFPAFFSYVNSGFWGDYVNKMVVELADSGYLKREDILPYANEFYKVLNERLKDKQAMEDESYRYYDLIHILGILNTDISNSLLNKMLSVKDKYLQLATIKELFKNNKPVNPALTLSLAKEDLYRYDLYLDLKKINKLSFFPKQYLTQRLLGQSLLYQNATEDMDDEGSVTVKFLSEKVITYNGKKAKFYLYKVIADDQVYLGIAGPYSLKLSDIESSENISGVNWDETLTNTNADELFNNYLKYYGESD